MNNSLIYLASPYSHPNPDVREYRFKAACVTAGWLINNGRLVFAPIPHTHPIACHCKLPRGWAFWERYDRVMLERCDELVVLKLDGWDESVGVLAEVEIMRALSKPISYFDPLPLTVP